MAPKKLISMRVSDATDEKLSDLAEELGETKSSLISRALDKFSEEIEEKKRLSEAQHTFQEYLGRNLDGYTEGDFRIVSEFVYAMRRNVGELIQRVTDLDEEYIHQYPVTPDAIINPIRKTLDMVFEALEGEIDRKRQFLRDHRGN